MNRKNLEDLKEGLKDLGFSNQLHPDLEEKIKEGKPRFALRHGAEFDKLKMTSAIHFEKSDQSDKYKISKYDSIVYKHDDFYENKVQTFYINQNKGVTLKEAYNLLEGRSVLKPALNKDGQIEHNWMKLDFEKMERSGNYIVKKMDESQLDLKMNLSELPIKGIQNASAKEMLVRSLQKGNLEQVTILKGGGQEKMFIEANPQSNSINVYDSKLQKVEKETLVVRQSADNTKQVVKNNHADSFFKKPKNDLENNNYRQGHSRKRGLSH